MRNDVPAPVDSTGTAAGINRPVSGRLAHRGAECGRRVTAAPIRAHPRPCLRPSMGAGWALALRWDRTNLAGPTSAESRGVTMLYVLHALDRSDGIENRAKHYREHRAHLDRAASEGVEIVSAGSLVASDGE